MLCKARHNNQSVVWSVTNMLIWYFMLCSIELHLFTIVLEWRVCLGWSFDISDCLFQIFIRLIIFLPTACRNYQKFFSDQCTFSTKKWNKYVPCVNKFVYICWYVFFFIFQVNKLLDNLCKVQVLESRQELYSRHTKPLINQLRESANMWTVHSTERLLFDTLLIECGKLKNQLLNYQ